VGYNYRLSNILAALGRAQLRRLPQMIERRRLWRRAYAEIFAATPGVQLFGGDDGNFGSAATRDNYWLSSILVDPSTAGWEASDLQAHLEAANIEARPLWKPMHLQPVHAHRQAYLTGTSAALFRTGLSLPSGSALTDAQFARVSYQISGFLRQVRS
jgi:dTDP-4-amino-4,6-dideoxygalactose transaminase